jgi:hypothetical protein
MEGKGVVMASNGLHRERGGWTALGSHFAIWEEDEISARSWLEALSGAPAPPPGRRSGGRRPAGSQLGQEAGGDSGDATGPIAPASRKPRKRRSATRGKH